MDQADFFVSPTLHNTFGYAPLETLACGTPVIATDICAQPEIVEDEQSGYLLPIEKVSEVGKWRYLSQRHDTAYQSIYEQTIVSLASSLAEVVRRCWENLSGYEATQRRRSAPRSLALCA